MFSDITCIEFVDLFICAKKEKIERLLHIKTLNYFNATTILRQFILDTEDEFWLAYSNKYDLLFDEVFFVRAIDVLKKSKKSLSEPNKCSHNSVPHISFVA